MSSGIIPGIYEHYKGNKYRVIGVARMSGETEEEMAVYQALYGEYGMWIRSAAEFVEEVELDGKRVPRFRLIIPTM